MFCLRKGLHDRQDRIVCVQVYKVLKSALANAKYKFGPENIKPRIVNVIVNRGPVRKHPFYRSRGRIDWKKTPSTHIWAFLEV